MNLQAGDYIISMHPAKETWELVLQAIKSFSDEHGTWQFLKDLDNDRVTATMSYMEGEKIKRTLMIEINGYPTPENTRLELKYTVWPDQNLEIPEQIIGQTVELISQMLRIPAAQAGGASAAESPDDVLPAAATGTAGGTAAIVYSADSPELPPQLLEIGKASADRVMNVIEICLLLGFALAVINPFTFAVLAFFGFPGLVIVWGVRDFKKYSATKWSGQSLLMRLLRFTPDIICRVIATGVAMPFIALGLCASAFLLNGILGPLRGPLFGG